ncbi:hypothetical protein STSO111631_14625 [Stackebrandtia soli]
MMREKLRRFREELSAGRVSAQLWSGVVECGAEATSLRQAAMDTLDNDPECERARVSAQYAIRIENDIWSFADAIAGLCLKQAGVRREGDG